MSQPLFAVTTRHVDVADGPPVTVVEVGGEVDVSNAEEFEQAINGVEGTRPVVADLSRLDYIDSAGFAVLDRLLTADAITIVLDPRSPVRAAATLVRLPCHDSLHDAVAASGG